jgi:hypothetical protein
VTWCAPCGGPWCCPEIRSRVGVVEPGTRWDQCVSTTSVALLIVPSGPRAEHYPDRRTCTRQAAIRPPRSSRPSPPASVAGASARDKRCPSPLFPAAAPFARSHPLPAVLRAWRLLQAGV